MEMEAGGPNQQSATHSGDDAGRNCRHSIESLLPEGWLAECCISAMSAMFPPALPSFTHLDQWQAQASCLWAGRDRISGQCR